MKHIAPRFAMQRSPNSLTTAVPSRLMGEKSSLLADIKEDDDHRRQSRLDSAGKRRWKTSVHWTANGLGTTCRASYLDEQGEEYKGLTKGPHGSRRSR